MATVAAPPRITRKMQQRLARTLLRQVIPLSRAMEQPLLRAFARWGQDASAAYLRHAHKLAKAAAPGDATVVRAIMDDLQYNLFRDKVLKPIYENQYKMVGGETVNTINRTLGLGINLSDAGERRILKTGGTRLMVMDVQKPTRATITRLIAEGRGQGHGPAKVARMIRDQVPAGRFVNAGPKYRALLIARTETKYAQNTSSLTAYREAPGITGALAFDAQGEVSDEECIQRDGNVYSFEDADVELASEHPNGTLSFAPATGGG